jgi:hypothetical protein
MFGTTAGMGHAYGGMGGHYGGYNPLAAASLMDPYSTGGMMNAAMMTGGYGGASTAAGLNGLNAFNPLVHGTGINPYSFMFNNNNGNGLNGLLGDGGYGGGFTTSSNNGFNGPSPNFIHTGSSGRQFRRHDRHYGMICFKPLKI